MYTDITPNGLYHIAFAAIVIVGYFAVLLYGVRLIVRTVRESWRLASAADTLPPRATLQAAVPLVLVAVVLNASLYTADFWQSMAPNHERGWFDTPITSPEGVIDTVLIGARAVLRAVAEFEVQVALAVLAFALFALVLRTDWVSRATAAVRRGVQAVRRSHAAEPISTPDQ